MSYELRQFDFDAHYPLMLIWHDERDYPAPPEELLPRVGFVIEHAETPVVAGFLMKTDTQCAIICHLISDPKSDYAVRGRALDILIEQLTREARESKFRYVSAASNLERLLKRYDTLGFKRYDNGVTNVAKELVVCP